MKLFSTTAYHSTTQKGLTQFEDITPETKAKTGEGAMVHGFGLYLQEDQELNIENYKDRLDTETTVVTIKDSEGTHTYTTVHSKRNGYTDCVWRDENGNVFDDVDDYIGGIAANYPSVEYYVDDMIRVANEAITRCKRDWEEYHDEFMKKQIESNTKVKEMWEDFKRYVESIEYSVKNSSTGSTTQYEVEIPDDFVFMDEDEFPSKEIKDIFRSIVEESISGMSEEELRELGEYSIGNDAFYLRKVEDFDKYRNDFIRLWSVSTCGTFYEFCMPRLIEKKGDIDFKNYDYSKVSVCLRDRGIDGISYYGNRDGYCWVIFNCKDLKIVGEV